MRQFAVAGIVGIILVILAACAPDTPTTLPPSDSASTHTGDNYIIGPGDKLHVFVWQDPQLSVEIPVRPDGKISVPLVNDIVAVGKTPTELGNEIQGRLKTYVKDPRVTVIVEGFVGPFSQQVRVIGEAAVPQAVPFRTNMTLLDVMISVGGLTKFAAGNRAVIVRRVGGEAHSYPVMLDSLIRDGEIKYNVKMQPGDILIIPQSYF